MANIAGLAIAPADANQVIQPLLLDSQGIGWWRRVVGRDEVVAELHLAVPLDDARATRCGRRSTGSRRSPGRRSGSKWTDDQRSVYSSTLDLPVCVMVSASHREGSARMWNAPLRERLTAMVRVADLRQPPMALGAVQAARNKDKRARWAKANRC